MTLIWLLCVARAVFRFRRWRQGLSEQQRSIATLLSRQIPPLLLAFLPALFVLRAMPDLFSGRLIGYPLSMLRLAPDVRLTLLLLACLTLLLALAKLAIIAGVLLKSRKVPA